MINLVWDSKARRLRVRGKQSGSYLESGFIATIMTETEVLPLPYGGALESDDGLRLTGQGHGFAAAATWSARQGEHCPYYDVTLQIVNTGAEPVAAGVQISLGLVGSGRPTWLVPGSFYRENRLEECQRLYPRWDYEGGDPLQLVSDAWSFRADRAAVPAVFGWNEQLCGAMQTAEMSAVGLTGMGFVGNPAQTAIWLNFPYREEPVVFAAPGKPEAPDCPLYQWQPNEPVTLRYRVYVGGPELHAYDPFVRELYDLDREGNPLHPWMGLTEAAALSAHGLYTWHYKPADALLYETATFDREGSGSDRPNMHVAWVSGVPYAYALLTYGRKHEHFEYTIAATRVIDKIASGIAPCGTFYGEWRADRGWSQGWTPNRKWLHTRTLAEATLFMLRALRFEAEREIEHPAWRDAVLSNLRYIVAHQSREGSFGTYYHLETGEVVEWDGAGGILWIAGLVEGASFFNEPSFLVAAKRAGEYYAHFVADEFIYGAPEDVHLAPTSEDGYNATVAYLQLYEADKQAPWLELAAKAADWTMTFRWTYNLTFPQHSMLAQFDFRSRGADHASPSNQHLHNYGLFALPEMLRLAEYTGDAYYRERTRDNLACFLQFIAREDGDFNAYKGMITERYYNTHCFQPKGMMLTLSHAWSVGLTLYAAQEAERYVAELEGITQ